jgi:hypothetical protein
MDEFNMDDAFDLDGYTVNLEEVSKQKDLMAVTRLLAMDLQRDGYVVVGDFIKDISDTDLENIVQDMDREGDHQYDDLILISEMLATGEGCDASKTPNDFGDRMNQLMTLLVCESLARKGLVKVRRENMSFHPDMMDKIVVEKIEGSI